MISCSPGNFHQYDQLSEEKPTDQITTNATAHAITHCPITTPTAHLPPSSLLTDAIAATHGVYRRQNASRLAAAKGVIQPSKVAVLPNKTESVDTTLSFAINPVINAVEIRQSPQSIGLENRCNHTLHHRKNTVF